MRNPNGVKPGDLVKLTGASSSRVYAVIVKVDTRYDSGGCAWGRWAQSEQEALDLHQRQVGFLGWNVLDRCEVVKPRAVSVPTPDYKVGDVVTCLSRSLYGRILAIGPYDGYDYGPDRVWAVWVDTLDAVDGPSRPWSAAELRAGANGGKVTQVGPEGVTLVQNDRGALVRPMSGAPCTCDLLDLMRYGCRCGAITRYAARQGLRDAQNDRRVM